MGHQTPGSSQCQYWGKLGCSTPLGDTMLQPGTPECGSAKLLLLSGRGRKGTGCWAIHGTPTPLLPHKTGPPHVPLPSLALPQVDTSAGHSKVQLPQLTQPSGTSWQLRHRNGCHCQHQSEGLQHVELSPGGAQQAWGQAGLTLQEPHVALAITTAKYQGRDTALAALPLPGHVLSLRAWGARGRRDEDVRWSRDAHGQPAGNRTRLFPAGEADDGGTEGGAGTGLGPKPAVGCTKSGSRWWRLPGSHLRTQCRPPIPCPAAPSSDGGWDNVGDRGKGPGAGGRWG